MREAGSCLGNGKLKAVHKPAFRVASLQTSVTVAWEAKNVPPNNHLDLTCSSKEDRLWKQQFTLKGLLPAGCHVCASVSPSVKKKKGLQFYLLIIVRIK